MAVASHVAPTTHTHARTVSHAGGAKDGAAATLPRYRPDTGGATTHTATSACRPHQRSENDAEQHDRECPRSLAGRVAVLVAW